MATKKTVSKKRPKQAPLIEDARIEELDDVAEEYADIRDRRMALNREESDLKKRVKSFMHKYKKKEYHHEGVTVRMVAGEEDVKVTIKKAKKDDVEIEEE